MATVAQRTAIGLVLVGAFVGLLALDALTGRSFGVALLCLGLAVGGLVEYGRMIPAEEQLPRRLLVGFGAAYMALHGLGHELDPRVLLLATPCWLLFAAAVGFGCLRGSPSAPRLRGVAFAALGFVYLPVLGAFALEVRHVDPVAGPAAFFFVVAIAKGTDACAFFAGKAFGRAKLIPGVSPGKSTAGFVGALLGAAAIAALFSWFSALGRLLPLPLAPGVGMLLALVVISGDLVESFLKRAVDVKDSASLIPGFGGVLDVIDSVLAAAPAVYYLLLVARHLQ